MAMRKIVNDYRMMLQVCELYYMQDLSQSEIADVLEISRPTVKKLLTGAREKGLVKITISTLQGRNYLDLERRLEQKLGLREVIVVEYNANENQQKNLLAQGAAAFLEAILEDGDEVGVSMGTSLSRMPAYITSRCENTIFVPLLGGIGEVDINVHSNNIAEALGKAFCGESMRLHAPSIVARAQTKRELLKEESIQRVLNHYEYLDIALLGIGTADERSAIAKTGYFTAHMLEEIKKSGACGDICMYVYDQRGDTDQVLSNQGIIGISIPTLKKIPYIIGIAAGEYKANAIMGAVRGGLINTLVTDCKCAGMLMEM